MELMEHQLEAIAQLANGRVLYGGVGSGKSLAALGYYMEKESPRDIYVITTAKKRDSLDWLREASHFGIGTEPTCTLAGTLTVDSWNNIGRYVDVDGAFFIFDEQRVVGNGAWVRFFLKIAKRNHWILLSATPGDTWIDYAPIFIANGWYRNITDFRMQHVIYAPRVKFPLIKGYLGTDKLERLRNEVLVEMPFIRDTERIINYLDCGYDKGLWEKAVRSRWNVYEDAPIRDVAELFRVMRRIVNSDPSRIEMVRTLLKTHPKLIIFYNFNYELEVLRGLTDVTEVAEWNGHRKDPIPSGDSWVYLVQYIAGAEAWETTATDAMIHYSLTYSYKNFMQSLGRIDRIGTKWPQLYYYVLQSDSPIDRSILAALREKKSFNERIVRDEVSKW
jgi:hypothetical protein